MMNAPLSPLPLRTASHSGHHSWWSDLAHTAAHSAASGAGWWAGRSLAAQLGLGGIAALLIAVAVLWAVNRYTAGGDRGLLLITHYTRILRYVHPDVVHVFVDGRVAETGGKELAEELEANGYERFTRKAA